MIKINKNIAFFGGLILFLALFSLFFLQQLLPFVSYTVYYCKSFVHSLSLPIPYYLSILPFVLFSLFLSIALIKLLTIYVKIQLFRRNLMKGSGSHMLLRNLLKKLKLLDKTYVARSDKQFAFCLGIRNPKIYISTGLLDALTAKEIEAVLLHERYHLKSRDTFTMLIATIGQSLLPFFPIFSDLLHNYRIEREIQADREAVQELGETKPVISVLKKLLSIPSPSLPTAPAIADYDTLEPRIYALVKKDFRFKRYQKTHLIISITSILVMSALMLTPVHALEIHQMGKNAMMICPFNDECLNSCKREYSLNKIPNNQSVMYSQVQ